MTNRFGRWARSRRGVCSIAASIAVLISALSDGSVQPAEALPLAVFVLPLMAGLVWFAAAVWEDKTKPKAPRFARESTPSASRQLREDPNAGIYTDHLGFVFEKRHYFLGTGCPPVRLKPDLVVEARMRQGSVPVLMAYTAARRFWWYRGLFYWENKGLEGRDVMALLHERDRRHSRELDRAHVLLNVEQGLAAPAPRQRQPLTREIRQAVFQRDGGRCVECQSNFDLQYDHVIPWSLGGADTVQNLQLLCSPCNQRKGANF
jgi:hypothetical protein